MKKKIPQKFKVGGQSVEVHYVERSIDNSLGICNLAGGYIEIATMFNKDEAQCEESKVNTFYHELTHCILKTMGEMELNANEKFVSCFSSFLTEAMQDAYFEKEEDLQRVRI